MALELSPKQAGEVADSTYALRLSDNMIDAAAGAAAARDDFAIVSGQRLTGATGIGPASRTTGFGYIAFGKSGPRQGECLLAIRGTEKSSAHDWLTNTHMAGVQGPGGYTVHAGFWNLAAGILPQIQGGLRGRNPSLIHAVGHSLGGATATLIADALNRSHVADIKLYTFGAPRAGIENHASALTRNLGRHNIFRAYHHTDPVPMVPVFPYAHVPFEEDACLLHGCGTLISVDAHLMPTYLASVGNQTWPQLPQGAASGARSAAPPLPPGAAAHRQRVVGAESAASRGRPDNLRGRRRQPAGCCRAERHEPGLREGRSASCGASSRSNWLKAQTTA